VTLKVIAIILVTLLAVSPIVLALAWILTHTDEELIELHAERDREWLRARRERRDDAR
jgi:hypothetical protein